MDNKSIIEKLKNMFFKLKEPDEPPTEKKSLKSQYVILLLLAGIAFMLISNLFSNKETIPTTNNTIPVDNRQDEPTFGQKKEAEAIAISQYEESYENRLKESLEAIVGVEDVIVTVNVDATETKVLEKNSVSQSQTTEETDPNGGKRRVDDVMNDEQVVVVRNGDQEVPIVIKIVKPEIRSVLVVAKGVDNIHIKQMVVEAVTKGMDVPNHKVAVLPRKTKGD